MKQKRLVVHLARKREELFHVFLMRNNENVNHGYSQRPCYSYQQAFPVLGGLRSLGHKYPQVGLADRQGLRIINSSYILSF